MTLAGTSWKTTTAGILSALIAVLTTLVAFEIPTALQTPNQVHVWLWVTVIANGIVALARVVIGFLQVDPIPPVVTTITTITTPTITGNITTVTTPEVKGSSVTTTKETQ